MKEIRHQNLASLLGVCTEEGYYYLVTELMEKGSLKDILKKQKNMEQDRRLQISMQVRIRLYMQRQHCMFPSVYHVRPIFNICWLCCLRYRMEWLTWRADSSSTETWRLGNVLIGGNDEVKIADFGMSRIISEGAYEAPFG